MPRFDDKTKKFQISKETATVIAWLLLPLNIKLACFVQIQLRLTLLLSEKVASIMGSMFFCRLKYHFVGSWYLPHKKQS